ncbi:hypothetical protein NKDENANG_03809 [Candidatus Entotheonellaceae bacterium PAL068K]
MSAKKEFGDFQTPDDLATKATTLLADIFGTPDVVVEPTAGLGAFLKASVNQWGHDCHYEGYEINREYVDRASECLGRLEIELFHRDFFSEDWKHNLNRSGAKKVLVIGNPPWVTNSDLGLLGSRNLPKKTNFQRLRGFDARTGKSNFDLAEWMLIRLIEALPPEGAVAMLCKTMTARKVLRHFWKTDGGREGSCLFHIDAKATFDVAVDACFFVATGRIANDRTATIYADLDLTADSTQFGFIHGALVSDIAAYNKHRDFDGGSSAYTWRSGIKHDTAKVMEFTRDGHLLHNGLGQSVDLEDEFIYPLLKSSDLGSGRVEPRKYVLVTQTHTGDDASVISSLAPKTWNYLTAHGQALDARRSSIYQNRPRFSVFGIGRYSFAPWKVAISGLYKSFAFVVVPPSDDRPVMVDDTCYSIPCNTEAEANLLCELLSSEPALEFLRSLVFTDSKRPITIDVLRRISLVSVARHLGRLDELQHFIHSGGSDEETEQQMTLLMEPKQKYRTTPFS